MAGFFSATSLTVIPPPNSLIPQCGACGLFKNGCRSPKMAVSGKGQRGILLIGDFPSEEDDLHGSHFHNSVGAYLKKVLAKFGIDIKSDCYRTNALICFPRKSPIGPEEFNYCRPNLIKTINELQPKLIIPLGGRAVQSLCHYTWKSEDVGEISRWAGFQIPHCKLNAWICPVFDPRIVYGINNPVTTRLFENHIQQAVRLKNRPWKDPPNYGSKIKVILNPDEAASELRRIAKKTEGEVAFDYETTTLKPDNPSSRIVSCAVCYNGNPALAYPWCGSAIEETKKILLNTGLAKIASNLKFEERWTKAKLGINVRNWGWDTMLAAHTIYNSSGRRPITSIKFQAHVLLGIPEWDSETTPYLKSSGGGNAQNRIKEVDLTTLLTYNAYDALYEFYTAKIQQKIIGVKK